MKVNYSWALLGFDEIRLIVGLADGKTI